MRFSNMSIKCDEPIEIQSADGTDNSKQLVGHSQKNSFRNEFSHSDSTKKSESNENEHELLTLNSDGLNIANQDDKDLTKKITEISTESLNDNCYSKNGFNRSEKMGSFEDFKTHLETDSNNYNADCNDDFSEFASFDTQNFANFENMNCENASNGDKADDDEEFADFETVKTDQNYENVSVDHKTQIIQDLIKDSFPVTIQTNCDISSNLFDASISKQSGELWEKLQTIDMKSNFYNEKWKNSSTFQFLLKALKIDPRNVIHPDLFFSRPCNQILQPTLYQSMPNAPLTSQSTDFSEKLEFNNTNNSDFQYVLHLNQDLDFFESKYNSSKKDMIATVKDDLISEFEDESLQKPSKPIPQSSSATDLKEMLKISMVNPISEQVLSAEALQVLSELPNLSFVRAKVLMFPIQHETNSEN